MRVIAALHCLAIFCHTGQAIGGDYLESYTREASKPKPDSELMYASIQGFIRESDSDALESSLNNPRLDVSLYSAWERARRRCEKEFISNGAKSNQIVFAKASSRFVGFTEGRLGCCLPDWWRKGIQNAVPKKFRIALDGELEGIASASSKRVLSFAYGFDGQPPEGKWLTQQIHSQGELELRFDGLELSTKDSQRMHLTFQDIDHVRVSTHSQSIALSACQVAQNTIAVAVVPGRFPNSGRIWCLNSKTGEVIWESSLGVSVNGGGTGSGISQRLEVVRLKGSVAVFGGDGSGMYLEVFALTNGKCMCRFFTAGPYVMESELPPIRFSGVVSSSSATDEQDSP